MCCTHSERLVQIMYRDCGGFDGALISVRVLIERLALAWRHPPPSTTGGPPRFIAHHSDNYFNAEANTTTKSW